MQIGNTYGYVFTKKRTGIGAGPQTGVSANSDSKATAQSGNSDNGSNQALTTHSVQDGVGGSWNDRTEVWYA